MDPLTNSSIVSSWLSVVTGPFGGSFALGVVFGSLVGIWLWQKYVVVPRIQQHEAGCEAKLAALKEKVDQLQVIANKWNKFMERKAFAALKESTDDYD